MILLRQAADTGWKRLKPGLGVADDKPDSLANFASNPGRQAVIRIEVRNCYRFTSRAAVYPKFKARFDECPVMASNRTIAVEQAIPGFGHWHGKQHHFNHLSDNRA